MYCHYLQVVVCVVLLGSFGEIRNDVSTKTDSVSDDGRLRIGVTVRVCKQFEFVIISVNNVKTARQKTGNQSENEYG